MERTPHHGLVCTLHRRRLPAGVRVLRASETALTGASRASMLRLSKQGNREADVVTSLFAMRERLIGALLLGNNIANIGASALATGIFTAWFGEVGVL